MEAQVRDDKIYFDHVEKHSQSNPLRRVLIGETSLKKEVEDFYGIHPYYSMTRMGLSRENDLDGR